jgi:hypothetical protein
MFYFLGNTIDFSTDLSVYDLGGLNWSVWVFDFKDKSPFFVPVSHCTCCSIIIFGCWYDWKAELCLVHFIGCSTQLPCWQHQPPKMKWMNDHWNCAGICFVFVRKIKFKNIFYNIHKTTLQLS